MQKWDALHSMLIFVCMDMKYIIGDESEGWKLTPPVKGLGSPFLLKVRALLAKFRFLTAPFPKC